MLNWPRQYTVKPPSHRTRVRTDRSRLTGIEGLGGAADSPFAIVALSDRSAAGDDHDDVGEVSSARLRH
jgi:hypothetical protein